MPQAPAIVFFLSFLTTLPARADINPDLIAASKRGHTETVKIYLAKGADVNAETSKCTTALIIAAMRGRTAIMKMLLNNGAQLDANTDGGISAMDAALLNGRTDAVELLEEKKRGLRI